MTVRTASARPILFSLGMVQAILDDQRTQTRRVIRPEPLGVPASGIRCGWLDDGVQWGFRGEDREWVSPYGSAGDSLWVRETWQQTRQRKSDGERFCLRHPGEGLGDLHYAADGEPDEPPRWRPSIHMPRWASRITLTVTEVRAERLHAITVEDCRAEGILLDRKHARGLFQSLWECINARRGYGWTVNPWVWVVTFRRCRDGAWAR
jgi:hypothetical protein